MEADKGIKVCWSLLKMSNSSHSSIKVILLLVCIVRKHLNDSEGCSQATLTPKAPLSLLNLFPLDWRNFACESRYQWTQTTQMLLTFKQKSDFTGSQRFWGSKSLLVWRCIHTNNSFMEKSNTLLSVMWDDTGLKTRWHVVLTAPYA